MCVCVLRVPVCVRAACVLACVRVDPNHKASGGGGGAGGGGDGT